MGVVCMFWPPFAWLPLGLVLGLASLRLAVAACCCLLLVVVDVDVVDVVAGPRRESGAQL